MIQQHQNQWPGPNSEFRNAFSKKWQEHVLKSIHLGKGLRQNATPGESEVPKPESPFEEEFDTPSEGEPCTEGGERGAHSGRKQQGLEHVDTLESLELPEPADPADPASPARAPQRSPAMTPLPSPMLEVPPTPTPSESPRSKPLTSPRFTPGSATPSMTPMASPMWQPLSEALLPTPQPKAEPGGWRGCNRQDVVRSRLVLQGKKVSSISGCCTFSRSPNLMPNRPNMFRI